MDATNKVPNSPEFEFWMLRNPSFPQPQILSADQLFANGLLLPLNAPHPNNTQPPPPPPEPPLAAVTPSSSSSSKRWKDIFRKSQKEKEKATKKEKKNAATTSPELNIRIWPFSRSRSAPAPPRLFPGAPSTRKVNSAPCSRSNSSGESKSRMRPSSPARPGLHLGRSSPVWQVRRPKNPETSLLLNPESHPKGPTSRRSKAGSGGGSAKASVLNVNVPTCIAYRHHLSCRSDANSAISVSGGFHSDPSHATSVAKAKFFNLRTLFTKKTVVTSH